MLPLFEPMLPLCYDTVHQSWMRTINHLAMDVYCCLRDANRSADLILIHKVSRPKGERERRLDIMQLFHLMRRRIRKQDFNKLRNCHYSRRSNSRKATALWCRQFRFRTQDGKVKWGERDNVVAIIESYNYFSRLLFLLALYAASKCLCKTAVS